MACYHPITAYRITDLELKSKKIVFAEPRKTKDYEKVEEIKISCGKCCGCRLEDSRQWAMRIMMETKNHDDDSNWFITLTYSSDPAEEERIRGLNGFTIDRETGEFDAPLCLRKDDVQKFMDDLRRHWEYHYNTHGIKHYLAGEYGDKNKRPHYHLCVFGLKPHTEMIPLFMNELHQQLYQWPEIEKIWKHGIVTVGKITFESACYTARYVMKKRKGRSEEVEAYYNSLALIPEFTLKSNRPGIGRKWYDEHKNEIYKNDQIILTGYNNKVMKLKPPKYYDRLYDVDEHEIMDYIKEERKYNAEQAAMLKHKKTSLSEKEQLAVEERKKENQIKKLVRKI